MLTALAVVSFYPFSTSPAISSLCLEEGMMGHELCKYTDCQEAHIEHNSTLALGLTSPFLLISSSKRMSHISHYHLLHILFISFSYMEN